MDENAMVDARLKTGCVELPSNLVKHILEIASQNLGWHENCVLHLCISVCKVWNTEATELLVSRMTENLHILDPEYLDALDETSLAKKQIQLIALERLESLVVSKNLTSAKLFVGLGGVQKVFHAMHRLTNLRIESPMVSEGESSEDENVGPELTVKSLDARECGFFALFCGIDILRCCMDLAEKTNSGEAGDGNDAAAIDDAHAEGSGSSVAAKTGSGGGSEEEQEQDGDDDEEDEETLERGREQNREVLRRYEQVLGNRDVWDEHNPTLLERSKRELEARVEAFGRDWGHSGSGLQAQTHTLMQEQLVLLKKVMALHLEDTLAEETESKQDEKVLEMHQHMEQMQKQTQQHLQQLSRLQAEWEAARDPIQTVLALGGVGLVLSRMVAHRETPGRGAYQVRAIQFFKSILNTENARAVERLDRPWSDTPVLLGKKKRYQWTRVFASQGQMRFHYGYSSRPHERSDWYSDYGENELNLHSDVVGELLDTLKAHEDDQHLHAVALSFLRRWLRVSDKFTFGQFFCALSITILALTNFEDGALEVFLNAGWVLVLIAERFLASNSRVQLESWAECMALFRPLSQLHASSSPELSSLRRRLDELELAAAQIDKCADEAFTHVTDAIAVLDDITDAQRRAVVDLKAGWKQSYQTLVLNWDNARYTPEQNMVRNCLRDAQPRPFEALCKDNLPDVDQFIKSWRGSAETRPWEKLSCPWPSAESDAEPSSDHDSHELESDLDDGDLYEFIDAV